MSTLALIAMGNLSGRPPHLTLDAAGEYAVGATVLAAYWPKDSAHQVVLRSHIGGKRELLIPLYASVIDQAIGVLATWGRERPGASVSVKLLQDRIRAEAARVACSAPQ